MAGPILHGEDRVPRASRPTSLVFLPLSSAVSDMEGNAPIPPSARIDEEDQHPHYVFPPEEHRVVEQSPTAMYQPEVSSAPAELHDPHHRLSHPTQNTGAGHSRAFKSLPFELNTDAPYRAIRDTHSQSIHQAAHPIIPAPSDESEDTQENAQDVARQAIVEELAKDLKEGFVEALGRPFRVNWIRTEHLSFFRTKHLRNPWNHGREVKISRDGTELEPSVGWQLLEEWDKRPPSPADTPAPTSRIAQRRRGSKST
jgi:YT521-B-like domain